MKLKWNQNIKKDFNYTKVENHQQILQIHQSSSKKYQNEINILSDNKDNRNKENNDNKESFDNKEKEKFYTPESYGEKTLEISFNYSKAIKAQLIKNVNNSIINFFPTQKLKFALCTIGKLENLYARDFVIYYLELGVDTIFIYDNNEINGEKFEDVLQDFIDKKLVKIINMRGNQEDFPQRKAYDQCYHDHLYIYDWFLFFDFDEYLYIGNNSLDNFVKLNSFNNCSSIIYYRRDYADNDHLYYSEESLIKRFTNAVDKDKQKILFFLKQSQCQEVE